MEKTMYWADIEDAKLTESYLIPRTTLLGWKEKRGNPKDRYRDWETFWFVCFNPECLFNRQWIVWVVFYYNTVVRTEVMFFTNSR